jgi:hypothetical protein
MSLPTLAVMDSAVGIVDCLLRVAQHKRIAGLLSSIVSGIGLRKRKALLQRVVSLSHTVRGIECFAGGTAVTDHVEAPIPFGRQAEFKSDLHTQQSGDIAKRRHSASGRLHRRGSLRISSALYCPRVSCRRGSISARE